MGLVVISPAFDKEGNRKIDIKLFNKFLLEELPRIGSKAYLIYKGTSLVAQMVKRLSTTGETWAQFLGWEDPREKEIATHSNTLA